MDILNIENCTIRYQEQEAAVEHVSLSVGEQEIVSIVGESGSGKTTLIRAILGILPPGGTVTEGKILFQGKNILELDETSLQKLRGTEIAMIFQDVGASLDAFVSWCANECGYIDSGIIPKYAGCVNGAQWFKDRGQWADRNYEPAPGTIIFFDWEGDGVTDHTGIVQKCENGTVYTVEGNSGDTCRTKTYPDGSSVIYGYGIPAY